jgi:hypothetical protein
MNQCWTVIHQSVLDYNPSTSQLDLNDCRLVVAVPPSIRATRSCRHKKSFMVKSILTTAWLYRLVAIKKYLGFSGRQVVIKKADPMRATNQDLV